MMFFSMNIFLFFCAVAIVRSEGQSNGKNRRDEDTHSVSDPAVIDNADTPQDVPSNLVEHNEENVQLITPSDGFQPGNIQDNVSSKPLNFDETNVQQIVPNDPNLQEVEADIPNAGADLAEPNIKLHAAKKAKVAAQKIHHAQERTGAKWPMGVVPYAIDTDMYDDPTIQRIVQAMRVIEVSSCVLFRELRKKPRGRRSNAWLYITNPKQERACVHETKSSITGEITVVLGIECLHPHEILHSILHAIGFKDEVSHPHRDQYIRIMWENIQPKYRNLFRIQYEDAPYKLVEYDPLSIMHFHDRAFSANGAATIAPQIPGLQIGSVGSPRTLSQLDAMKLKLAFGHECNKRKIGDLLDTCKKALVLKDSSKPSPGDSDIDSRQR